jgi:hypothetical protein
MGKGAILDIIKEALGKLRSRNDPFHEIAGLCDDIQRAVTELRKMDSSKGQYIEQLTADKRKLEAELEGLRTQAKDSVNRNREVQAGADRTLQAARAATLLAKNIMLFHENFRMDSLEKKLGEEYNSLKKKTQAVARQVQQEFRRKRNVSPEDMLNLFFKQMESVQKCATDREDQIYEACRQTIINFSIYLAAAITKFGPIVVDENTELQTMEFVVEGDPPIRFTVRAKTEEEQAQDQAIEYRLKMQKMMDSVQAFAELSPEAAAATTSEKELTEMEDFVENLESKANGKQTATIVVNEDGLKLVARHLMRGECTKIKPPLDPNENIPINYVVENEQTGLMTVQCGLCEKNLGTCKLQKVIDNKGKTYKAHEINKLGPDAQPEK